MYKHFSMVFKKNSLICNFQAYESIRKRVNMAADLEMVMNLFCFERQV